MIQRHYMHTQKGIMKQTHCFLQYGLITLKKAGIITIFKQLTPTDLLKPYKSGYLEPTSLRLIPAQAGDNSAV